MKKLVFVIALLFCGNAYSANDQVPKDRVITEINIYEGEAVVNFSPGFPDTQNCPDGSNTKAIIDLENDQGKALYSTALAAASSKKKVGFGFSGCKNSPKIYRLDVVY